MILTLDLDSDEPLFILIADAIQRSLIAGDLKPGDQLPPGRELAAALEVSLETVQRAYRRLADAGVVVSRVGRGTRVVDSVDPDKLGVDNALRELIVQAKRVGLSKDQLIQLIDTSFT